MERTTISAQLPENWVFSIPHWETEANKLNSSFETYIKNLPQKNLNDLYPGMKSFFSYFLLEQLDNVVDNGHIIPKTFPELDKFLVMLRKSAKNMFVAPMQETGYIDSTPNNDQFLFTIPINVVWESFSLFTGTLRGIYGAMGDIGYIQFTLNSQNVMVDFRWKGLQYPPNYQSFDEIDKPIKRTYNRRKERAYEVREDEQFFLDDKSYQIYDLPTFYDDCDYKGNYILMEYGYYGSDWLKSTGFYNTISSVDAHSYKVELWLDKNNVEINNERVKCLEGERNDKTQTIVIHRITEE